MKIKIKLLLLTLLVILGYYFQDKTKSKYEELVNPIKKIKIEQKKKGIPNPIYEGIREPDFPDEDKNDETLYGVDANQDGVRDDIEIWINRTAEDQYVRIAFKELYKRNAKFHYSLEDKNLSDQQKIDLRSDMSDLHLCFDMMLTPYEEDYLLKGIALNRKYDDQLYDLIFNTHLRGQYVTIADTHTLIGEEQSRSSNDLSFCKGFIDIEYVKSIIEKRREKAGRKYEK